MSEPTKSVALTIAVSVVAGFVLLGAMACGTVIYLAGGSPLNTPKPEVSRLAELVPDADSRARLSAFFGDFSLVITQDAKPLKTTGDFREAYRLAVTPLKTSARLPDVKAIDEPISDRIASAIGLADTALDGEPPLRSNLAATLTAISDDFGGR
jgi:hypothetical protein